MGIFVVLLAAMISVEPFDTYNGPTDPMMMNTITSTGL